jgi:hypothetical protein
LSGTVVLTVKVSVIVVEAWREEATARMQRKGRAGPPWPAHLSPAARGADEKNLNRKAAKIAKVRNGEVVMGKDEIEDC